MGEYDRYNMQRMISVTANISGSDLGTVAKQVAQALRDVGNPPPKVTVTVRGQTVPLQQMLDGLQKGLLAAILVIFPVSGQLPVNEVVPHRRFDDACGDCRRGANSLGHGNNP